MRAMISAYNDHWHQIRKQLVVQSVVGPEFDTDAAFGIAMAIAIGNAAARVSGSVDVVANGAVAAGVLEVGESAAVVPVTSIVNATEDFLETEQVLLQRTERFDQAKDLAQRERPVPKTLRSSRCGNFLPPFYCQAGPAL